MRKKSHGMIDDLDNVNFIFSDVNPSPKEALLYIFEDNEAVIKMIIKGRSLTMRHVSRTHRVALDWLFDRINLDPKIQIKYIDTKNQRADILTKGNFTRDECNHLLCLFNISHFSFINNLEAISKRTPEDAGAERVTAKSKPMMNLVSRYSVRDPNVLASTASESPGKTKSESQNVPLSSLNDKPPDIWNTHGISGNVFVNPPASSSSPFPWDFSKDYGADQQRLQISDLHFDKFPTPTTLACWKIRFKNEVCTCSQFPTEAMLWTKEVELVGSVDDLKSSRSTRGTASALNRIIHSTQFKRKVSLEEQKAKKRTVSFVDGRSLTWPTSTFGSLEPMIPSKIMQTYLQLFLKWWYSGIRFEVRRNFIINDANPIWWHLGKLVEIKYTRVWETQDRIGIVRPGDSSEESWTWLTQVEDNGKKKYRAEFTNDEFWGQERKLWKKRRGQESGDKTAWTKNTRRLLAVESQRAVF